ncbi:hypothetical protein SUGI_0453120 [Cryptomeria japonica]|uniref:uncharacterized protein LOC131875694 n=1 Tax=Cryptomeria japonica TaxID=3369 RepID=UPI002408BEFC|nr:uncharacterized protein LOC131875694 [Cryptomeria japonica]GLJ23850.1 hypothetical protein SUGI_0453120 [Cryptomeria japonica]
MASKICRELENVFVTVEVNEIDPRHTIVKEIMKMTIGGGHVVVHDVGREGLMMKGFAMRLFHLDLKTACMGDMTAPHVGPFELLIASAASGWFGSVNAIIARGDFLLNIRITSGTGFLKNTSYSIYIFFP